MIHLRFKRDIRKISYFYLGKIGTNGKFVYVYLHTRFANYIHVPMAKESIWRNENDFSRTILNRIYLELSESVLDPA